MPREDIPEELVEIAAQAVERSLTFMGMEGTRLPGTEAVDVDATVRAVLSAVSEAGWVRASSECAENGCQIGYLEQITERAVTAEAQSEALAEAVKEQTSTWLTVSPILEAHVYEPNASGYVWNAWTRWGKRAAERATDALRAYRSSQESSDAT